MALASTMVWEVETSGSDNNGGGFDPGVTNPGTDYTYGAGQTVISWLASGGTYTNDLASTTGTKVISSASRNFMAADVGNVIHISAGTNFTAGWYEIVSVASNKATLDRDPTNGSNASAGSGYLGGPFASPAMATANMVGQNQIWIQSATYTITSASQNVSGGCPYINVIGTSAHPNIVEGYQTTRGDMGTPPILLAGTTLTYIFENNTNYTTVRNLIFDGSQANTYASYGFYDTTTNTTYRRVEYCTARYTSNTGIVGGTVLYCLVYSCPAGITSGYTILCEVYSCSTCGIATYYWVVDSLAYGCGIGIEGTGPWTVIGCAAYGNTSHGFYCGTAPGTLINCIAESNGTTGTVYGFNPYNYNMTLINCSGYNNHSGNYPATGIIKNIGFIAVTAGTVFAAPASNDFALNQTASQGALLRAAGFPATFPRGTTANYRDIGAAQNASACNELLTASMATLSGAIVKAGWKALAGGMATMIGVTTKQDRTGASASMATMAGAIVKQGRKTLAASLAAMGAAIAKLGLKSLLSSTATMSAAVLKGAAKKLAGSMAAFSGVRPTMFTTSLRTGSMAAMAAILSTAKKTLKSLVASMSAFSIALSRQAQKSLAAQSAGFAVAIRRAVSHSMLAAMATMNAYLVLPLKVLTRHAFGVPGKTKTGAVPGETKTGTEPGRVKTGTAPVH